MITKWKYKFIDTDEQGNTQDTYRSDRDPLRVIEGYADAIGSEGYELVAVVPRQDAPGYQYAFRRQIQAE